MSQEPTNVHNYYGMTFQNCSMPNATFQTINQASPASEPATANPRVEDTADKSIVPASAIPTVLQSAEACQLLERMVSTGLLDEHWQPVELSHAKRGLLAKELADRLCVAYPWTNLRPPVGHEARNAACRLPPCQDQRQALGFYQSC